MPSAGKTTIGKQMAFSLGYEFIDLDYIIEQKAGLSIPELFALYGETYFRKLEQEAVQWACSKTNIVVATGGGAPCFFDNLEKMNASGKSIYLKISVIELVARLYGNGQRNRPLLAGKSKEVLTDELTEKLTYRETFYNRATYTAKGDNLTASDLLKLIS
jgi:shikimate kinase